MKDIQISNDESTTAINGYKGSKGQKVQVEDIQISNDGSTTAIKDYNRSKGQKVLLKDILIFSFK